MITQSPVKERAVIDIRANVLYHSDIVLLVDDLLAIHGLPGADAVASLHGRHGQGNGCQSCPEGVFPTLLHW